MRQLSLFEGLQQTYQAEPLLTQEQLYARLQGLGCVTSAQLQVCAPVGRARQNVNLTKRRIRWHQIELRAMGIIERVEGQRGVWRAAAARACDDKALTPAPPRVAMIGFDTRLGAAIWGA